jgi:hypothetical protein
MTNIANIKSTTYIIGDIKKINSNSKWLYKDAAIICERKGSIIEIKNNTLLIQADITGIDKIYFKIDNNKIIISNLFKDFTDSELSEEFAEFQREKGFVPYPFTILKGVMKAPPGLIVKFFRNKDNQINYEFHKSKELEIFNRDKNRKFNKKEFRSNFTQMLLHNAKQHRKIVSSFSAGFDSTFLTFIYNDKCDTMLHFSEDKKTSIDHYKKVFPNKQWIILDNKEKFSNTDKLRYFKSIDEPCCDSAGFAEYLMIKKLKNNFANGKPLIMNGQACDGIFTNGKTYFQEFVSSKVPKYIREMVPAKVYSNRMLSRIQNYSLATKKRFLRIYLGNNPLSKETTSQISRIYDIYAQNIDNDSTNIFAACIMTLKYSLHGIEKIRTAAHAHDVQYYLPFLSENIIRYGFSIPTKFKAGFNSGKRILIEEYPEISEIKFTTKPFLPQKLKERFIGKTTTKKYCEIYTKNWIKYNQIHKS